MGKKQKSVQSESAKPAEFLAEKKGTGTKIREFAGNVSEKISNSQFQKDLAGFGKISLLVVPAILVVSGSLVATDMLLHGRILPGTTVGNGALAFSYVDDSAPKIQEAADNYLKTPLTINVNGVQTQLTPQELGMQFSLPQSLVSLPTYDFRKDSVLTLASSAVVGHKSEPFITFDSDKAQSVIEQKLALQKFRAQDAHITFDDKKNPTILAETDGKMLDRPELIAQLKQSASTLSTTPLTLALVDEKAAITAKDLESQKEIASTVLKTPLTLTYQGQKWKFDPSKHLDAITFEQNPTITLKNIHLTLPIAIAGDEAPKTSDNIVLASTPSLGLDQPKIHDFLQTEIISKIDQPTSDVKIYTDANKKIVIEGKGQNGVQVSEQSLIASLNSALSKNVKQLEVPAVEQKANVTISPDLQDRGIKNLVATGHTIFENSHSGRIKNIEVGMSKFNGTLVKKGETFSFNNQLGPVDGEHGFVKELVIKGSQGTIPDYGGGLCQVSSTMYQAALFAGFPIVERINHSYAVSYYAKPLGYGLDATIYPGVHDVRFVNNSPGDIIVQSYIENGDNAYFKFYGTDDGRKVWLEGPYQGNYRSPAAPHTVVTNTLPPGAKKQVEIAHTGFDVTWYRHILANNQETKDTIFTRYDNTGAEVLVGAGTPDTAEVPKT